VNEAELVLTQLLNCDRLSLYLNKDTCLNKGLARRMGRIFARRIQGEPLQYILGKCEFMGFEFKTDKRALIPRPETEILASAVLEKLQIMNKTSRPRVLDLGTGSGCIAVSIAKLMPQAVVWASDISAGALQLAKQNARQHNVEIKLIRSDIFSSPEFRQVKFDLILSNPPYIAAGEFKDLSKEISFEPTLALSAGVDGLDYYRNLSSKENQKQAFIRQITLAKELDLPLVIHCRQAEEDTLQILKSALPLRAVVHCFSGDKNFLQACLDLGFLISYTCNITYKKASGLREMVGLTPLKKLMLETDAPYLSPEGFRGKRNEPAQIKLLAQEISRIKGVSFEEVAILTTQNAKIFFKLP
jgi:release factor-specific protein-(glutamine-N5) methyltransferase